MRDINGYAEQGRQAMTEEHDMTVPELLAILEEIKPIDSNSIITAITKAYYFGYEVGHQQKEREQ